MKSEKQWIKLSHFVYQLNEGADKLATLNTKTGAVELKDKFYQIKSKGVFTQKITLENESLTKVIELKPKHWYSREYDFVFKGQNYSLKVRNNPLAEIVILKDGIEQLACGIKQVEKTDKVGVQIQEFGIESPIELHIVLWYLFYPVAIENCQDLTWILLMVN